MFFSINKFEEAVYPANQLQNPLNKDNPMTLRILRTQSRNAFFTVNSKLKPNSFLKTVRFFYLLELLFLLLDYFFIKLYSTFKG